MKAGSFLSLLVVIILMPIVFFGEEQGAAASSSEDALQCICYDLVSFHSEVMTDGNLTWIEYFEDVVVINELGDTVDAREGVSAHNIGCEVVYELERLRLCRPDSLNPQWTMKIPVPTYNALVAGLKLR